MISRRGFLGASAGAVLGALATSACSTAPGGDGGGGQAAGGKGLRCWDHFQPRADLHKKLFADFQKAHGVAVEYTVYNPNQQGQALQLAFGSKQLPDVFTTAGVQLPQARLRKEGWLAPIELDKEALSAMPQDVFLNGFTHFDDKLYSLPLVSFRQYATLTWYNVELAEKAGLDPKRDLASWDGFRASARKIEAAGGKGISGWVAPLQFAERMGEHVTDLSMAAGGVGSMDPRTGEYAHARDEYVNAIEFLVSLKKDDLLFPASSSLDARTARARWSTGVAGLFFDGPWNVGVVNDQFKPFLDKVGVVPIPVAEAGRPAYLYSAPKAGDYCVAATSQQQDKAAELVKLFASEEVMKAEAEQMDGMPVNIDLVDQANVHPTYKEAAAIFRNQVRLRPAAEVRNPGVSEVVAEMKQIQPPLGQIVQGALSGQVKDVRKALAEYDSKLTAERDRAVKAVAAKGGKVAVSDWAFANWTPGQDYDRDKYKSA
ncbi:multiple sugar transport system substrate-binding protein [Kribbella amoyensis]|uniref:Multiple sugar transport system substrate-binding protein n=1 Tax=Kribbella amoyensis TaxID=996641 RepID=A0A561C0L6_9ACTN|nr:extracellular solute-binding protein [Kribbella amoyensis]TWD84701.1 multiple sugar transport system substrate-binding protein [Kribbella amoyensis]